jgi:hypothetical protein
MSTEKIESFCRIMLIKVPARAMNSVGKSVGLRSRSEPTLYIFETKYGLLISLGSEVI